jgi:hypothetical protein
VAAFGDGPHAHHGATVGEGVAVQGALGQRRLLQAQPRELARHRPSTGQQSADGGGVPLGVRQLLQPVDPAAAIGEERSARGLVFPLIGP